MYSKFHPINSGEPRHLHLSAPNQSTSSICDTVYVYYNQLMAVHSPSGEGGLESVTCAFPPSAFPPYSWSIIALHVATLRGTFNLTLS